MTRAGLRTIFGVGVALAASTLLVAASAALIPKAAELINGRDIAVAKLSTLNEGEPSAATSHELAGLALKAWDLRAAAGPYRPMGPPKVSDLPIYLVRSDGSVRAFIGIDPRNGCRLVVRHIQMQSGGSAVTTLYDACHGSLYDLTGSRIGGPSPWSLDELFANVRDGVVYIDRSSVTPGRVMR